MKILLRLENVCLAIYYEEEVLHSKEKLSVLCFTSWMSLVAWQILKAVCLLEAI